MTEADLQEQVRLICRQLGLYHYHTHDSRRSQPGWPDSVIINRRTGAMIFRELKSDRGTLSPAQTEVKYMLLAGGQDYDVWRPADLLQRRIQYQLAALASTREAA